MHHGKCYKALVGKVLHHLFLAFQSYYCQLKNTIVMERRTFHVSFFLRRTRTSKKGLAPILARISTNGISKEVYIQCPVSPKKWSQDKERATGKDKLCQQVNAYLDDYRARIVEVQRELQAKEYEGNCIEIKNRLLNPSALSMMFLTEFETYCTKRQGEVRVRITQRTANKYHRVLRYLKEYTAAKYRKEDIALSSVNYDYIDGFNTFIQTAHNCQQRSGRPAVLCEKLYPLRHAERVDREKSVQKLQDEGGTQQGQRSPDQIRA